MATIQILSVKKLLLAGTVFFNACLLSAQSNSATSALQALETERAVLAVLKPGSGDSLSPEVVLLQKQLSACQDSILAIQQRLMLIVENNNKTKADKAFATQMLASIHTPEVLDYLFEHEPELQFGPFGSEQREEDELHRTSMKAIRKEYGNTRNWMVFPYLFQGLKGLSYSEMGIIHQWLSYPTAYNAPWLLLEFMEANASPESKPVIQYMLSSFPQFKRPKNSKD
ncbi:MAG: hypothetical protein KA138_12245 [Saprospiraceae bacterium]|jgi:hypothetical protein|nr:hypothetical protein [Saprospiraceae bacterium]